MKTKCSLIATLGCYLILSACQSTQIPPTAPPIIEHPTDTPVPTNTPNPTSTTSIPRTATPTTIPPTEPATLESNTMGQVKGTIIDGTTPQPEKPIFLAEPEENSPLVPYNLNILTSPQTVSNSSGEFMFINVPPGRYILVLTYRQAYPLTVNGKFFIIEVEAGQVVDLGTIIVEGNELHFP